MLTANLAQRDRDGTSPNVASVPGEFLTVEAAIEAARDHAEDEGVR